MSGKNDKELTIFLLLISYFASILLLFYCNNKNIYINNNKTAPEVTIIDEQGLPLLDKYYEVESTIQLTCIVRHLSMVSSNVFWSHGDDILNYDVTRGGIRYLFLYLFSWIKFVITLDYLRIDKSKSLENEEIFCVILWEKSLLPFCRKPFSNPLIWVINNHYIKVFVFRYSNFCPFKLNIL